MINTYTILRDQVSVYRTFVLWFVVVSLIYFSVFFSEFGSY